MLVVVNKREWVPMAMKRKLTGIAHYNRREKNTDRAKFLTTVGHACLLAEQQVNTHYFTSKTIVFHIKRNIRLFCSHFQVNAVNRKQIYALYLYTRSYASNSEKIFSQKATERLLKNLCSRAPTTMLKTTFSSFGSSRFRKNFQHFCLQISTKMMRLECLAYLSYTCIS